MFNQDDVPQAQQLLHTICYPNGLPGPLDTGDLDHKQLINRVLQVNPEPYILYHAMGSHLSVIQQSILVMCSN